MTESIETGLILMAAGMGTVFALLAALVGVVGLVSRLSRRLDPSGAALAAAAPVGAIQKPAATDELVTVIGAAVKAHRDRHGR